MRVGIIFKMWVSSWAEWMKKDPLRISVCCFFSALVKRTTIPIPVWIYIEELQRMTAAHIVSMTKRQQLHRRKTSFSDFSNSSRTIATLYRKGHSVCIYIDLPISSLSQKGDWTFFLLLSKRIGFYQLFHPIKANSDDKRINDQRLATQRHFNFSHRNIYNKV